ncbi:hypothetical protein AU186_07825 [Mycobacterium sp. GA-1999]|nr:hypothetical protein AU185_23385 [Mycobacterium sp. GA-0227b]KUH92321.1 hypothetical protein AU186_07825 [Mycobacterium sp. GA-1999]
MIRHDRVRVIRVSVFGSAVTGQDHGFAGASDRRPIVEIIGLGGGVFTRCKVIDGQYQRPDVFTHASTECAVGVAIGLVGEQHVG